MNPTKSQIAHLIQLAKVDGQLDHKEVMLVYGIAQKNKISKFEMDEIIAKADDDMISIPTSQNDRITYFYQLLIMATVDFEVSEAEVDFLQNLGAKFNLDPQKVQQAIDHIVEHKSADIDDETVASILG